MHKKFRRNGRICQDLINFTVQKGKSCDCISIKVADSGRGIHNEDLPYIFDLFYRGQGVSRSNKPGIGMGLSIVKEIVEVHNGRILMSSEIDSGTTFNVLLPAAK